MNTKPHSDHSNGVRIFGKSIWRLQNNITLNPKDCVVMWNRFVCVRKEITGELLQTQCWYLVFHRRRLFCDLLTSVEPFSRTVSSLVKKCPASYANRTFVPVFVKGRHFAMSWARRTQSRTRHLVLIASVVWIPESSWSIYHTVPTYSFTPRFVNV